MWVGSPHPFLEQSSGWKIEKGGDVFLHKTLIVGDERMENHLWRKLPDEKHIAKEYVFLALHIFIHR